MTKPRVFIGSSRESMETARAVQDAFDFDAEVIVWDQGAFEPSEYPLESLERELDRADFGIFIFFPDDLTVMRGESRNTVRDNVLFELGLFIGRLTRRRTFILIPRGADLHLPSDLAGITPVDYEADREDRNLLAAVGPAARRIRRVIQALPSRTKPTAAAISSTIEEEAQQTEITADWRLDFAPRADWLREEYEHAYLVAAIRHDTTLQGEVETAFRASGLAVSEESLVEWEGFQTYSRMLGGQSGAVANLQAKVARFPNNPRLNQFLGQAAMRYGDYARASAAFTNMLASARDLNQVERAVELLAEAAEGSRDVIDGAAILQKLQSLQVGEDAADQSAFARSIRLLADAEGLTVIAQGIEEVCLKLEPDNVDLRFATAYGYGEDDADLSLIHYENIPQSERTGTVWNNLGVAYASLQIPGKAVAAYKRAADKGETIADGNLAYKLLGAGFVDEARERAERAVATAGHHKTVVGALSAVTETEEAEEKRAAELRESASTRQAFMERLGLASLETDLIDICGEWQTADCSIRITPHAGGILRGVGEYEEESGGGFGLAGPFFTRTKRTVRVTIKLRRLGNAFEGTIVKTRYGGGDATMLSILSSSPTERPMVLFLEKGGMSAAGRIHTFKYEDVTWTRLGQIAAPAKRIEAKPQ